MSHAVKSYSGEGAMYPKGLDPYDVLADTCALGHSAFPTRWNGLYFFFYLFIFFIYLFFFLFFFFLILLVFPVLSY